MNIVWVLCTKRADERCEERPVPSAHKKMVVSGTLKSTRTCLEYQVHPCSCAPGSQSAVFGGWLAGGEDTARVCRARLQETPGPTPEDDSVNTLYEHIRCDRCISGNLKSPMTAKWQWQCCPVLWGTLVHPEFWEVTSLSPQVGVKGDVLVVVFSNWSLTTGPCFPALCPSWVLSLPFLQSHPTAGPSCPAWSRLPRQATWESSPLDACLKLLLLFSFLLFIYRF
jgi:hypothetical protein